jgi:signal transduction histidine kinase
LIFVLSISWPIGLLYVAWCLYNLQNVVRSYRGSRPDCTSTWRSSLNGCTDFSPALAWVEILAFTAVMAGLVVVLARWALAPLRAMAEIITQLGPGSLGLRMHDDGPRDEARQLADAIDAMLDRVAESYDAQRRFAANASHELRTPLATQRALIEISLSSALTPPQLELLSRQLLATNERNEALIEGLLVLAETERGLVTSARQRLDLIAGSTTQTLRASATERGIRIDEWSEPVEVIGEHPLLERLVSNLVQNAIKYNESGGYVQVVVYSPATLRVVNSGPPVPPELVPGLFEPFRRAAGDRLDHSGGVGLGLTIARSIVAAHHGSIVATANADGGLSVEVRLPSDHGRT